MRRAKRRMKTQKKESFSEESDCEPAIDDAL